MHYSPSYTLQPSPPPSDSIAESSPSPPPANSGLHLPPLPIPPSFNNHKNSFSRQGYPTSSPHPPPQQSSPEPNPGSKIRLPPPTSLFINGYASPAMSTYSSEPGSRDELELMEPASLGASFHEPGGFPGVDVMLREGMQLDTQSPRNENREHEFHRRWSMRDFNLVQTVGTQLYVMTLTFRNGDVWSCILGSICRPNSQST